MINSILLKNGFPIDNYEVSTDPRGRFFPCFFAWPVSTDVVIEEDGCTGGFVYHYSNGASRLNRYDCCSGECKKISSECFGLHD